MYQHAHTISIKIQGELDYETLKGQLIDLIRQAHRENLSNILIDLHEAEIVDLTIIKLSNLSREIINMAENENIPIHDLKRALIISNDHNEMISLLQTTALNIGPNLRVFQDHQEAIEWLRVE
jgi:NhaP-type Na+/H+ and K+/H+ antiporter